MLRPGLPMLGSGLARALPLELAAVQLGLGQGGVTLLPAAGDIGRLHRPETCKDCSSRSHGTQQLSPVSRRHPACFAFYRKAVCYSAQGSQTAPRTLGALLCSSWPAPASILPLENLFTCPSCSLTIFINVTVWQLNIKLPARLLSHF